MGNPYELIQSMIWDLRLMVVSYKKGAATREEDAIWSGVDNALSNIEDTVRSMGESQG